MKSPREMPGYAAPPSSSDHPQLPKVEARKLKKTSAIAVAPNVAADDVVRRFAGMGDLIGYAMVCRDLQGNITYWNAEAERLLGYHVSETIGQPFGMIFPPEGGNEQEAPRARINADEPLQNFETICRRKDGRTLDVSIATSLLKSPVGAVVGVSMILRDITEAKKSNHTLRLLQSCISNINDIVLVMDAASIGAAGPRIIYANDAVERVTGYAPSEMMGRTPQFLGGTEEGNDVLAEIWEAMRQGKPVRRQVMNRNKDGREFPMELDIAPVFDAAEHCTHFVGIYRDISELLRVHGQIEEQTALLDRAQDAIVVHDLEGNVVFWNKGAERIYGWTAREMVGRRIAEHVYVDPRKFHESNATTLEKGEWSGDLRHLAKDNRELIMETRWSVLREKDGRPKSVLTIKTNVTEKRKIEIQFIRAQRMASLGLLAGGIAHDLNNVLTPIMLSIDMLRGMVKDPSAHPVLETIEMSARRGSEIVQQVLSFARGMEGQRIVIQPKYMLKEIEHIVKDTFPKDIRLHFSLPHDTWTVVGDPTQIQQVLLNLCVNARDAMPHGGTLNIDAKNCLVDEQYVAMNSQARPGAYVVVSVADAGTGIPESIMDQIFEPFFTTKEVGKGTGLGLSSVQAIVRNHDGFINVYSEPGRGTTFKIYLPAQETAPDFVEHAPPQIELPRGAGETILVVDDEASILSVTRSTLEAFGYRMITAGNGAEAVAIYAQERDKIAAILTDLSMPVMDGSATIYALLKINPHARIIAMSGMDETKSVIMASNVGIKYFISKPYTAATLLKTLKAVVAS